MWYRVNVLLLSSCLLLCGGCSVRPLHELESKYKPQNDICGNIYVDVIAGKDGQMLRGHLQDLIRDLSITNDRYVLSVVLRENRVPYALADDCNAQRLKINLFADVKLKTLSGKNVLATSVTDSITRNIANAQGDIQLSMYDRVNSLVLKNLAFKIVENLKVALRK